MKKFTKIESIANIVALHAISKPTSQHVIIFLKIYWQGTKYAWERILGMEVNEGLSTNSHIATYDALRQALFVASDR